MAPGGWLHVQAFAFAGAWGGREIAEHDASDGVSCEIGDPHSRGAVVEDGLDLLWRIALNDVDRFVIFLQQLKCLIGGFREANDAWGVAAGFVLDAARFHEDCLCRESAMRPSCVSIQTLKDIATVPPISAATAGRRRDTRR